LLSARISHARYLYGQADSREGENAVCMPKECQLLFCSELALFRIILCTHTLPQRSASLLRTGWRSHRRNS
jgi:hypothetical protein